MRSNSLQVRALLVQKAELMKRAVRSSASERAVLEASMVEMDHEIDNLRSLTDRRCPILPALRVA